MEIFKLMGSIFVDTADAEKSISKTDDKVESFGSKLGKGVKTAAKWGAAVGAGAIAVGAGMYKMATSSAETTDRIDKLSQKIGMSRKGFQEMDFIASQSGMSIESLQVGFKTLRTAMEQAEVGKGKGAQAFHELGVSVTDSTGALRDQEEVFNEAVNKLQAMEDGTEKAMLATKLFGKSGQEMMPLLNGAAGSMEEMRQQANDLGLVLSDDAIDAGVAFTDTMDQLQRSFQTAVAEIGVQFMPIITKFADFIIDNMPTIQAVVGTAFDVMSTVIGVAVEWLSKIVDAIGVVVQSIVDWVKSSSGSMGDLQGMFKDKISSITDLFKSFMDLLIKMWDAWGKDILSVLKAAFDLIVPVFKFAFDLIVDVFKVFAALFKGDWEGAWQAVGNLLKNAWDNILVVIENALGLIEKVVILAFNVIKDAVKVVMDLLLSAIKASWDLIKKAFQAALDWLTKKTGVDFNAIKDGIKKTMDLVWNIIKTVWDYIKNTFQNVIAFISALVKGDFEGMKNAVMNQMENIKNTVKRVWENVTGIFKNAVSTISNAVGDTFDKAVTVVKAFGSKFFDAGKNIVGSIADGIKSAVSKVTDAIGGVVGKVRDFLPFSPAKVGPLKTLNKLDFGGPISDSIKNAIPTVNRAMDNLMSVASPVGSMTVGARYGSTNTPTTSNLQNPVIQIQPAPIYLDGRVIGEAVFGTVDNMMGDKTASQLRYIGRKK